MGRMFGLVLLLVSVWVGVEVYTRGLEGAFGGALASFAADDSPAHRAREKLSDRVESAARGAHRFAEERRDRLMSD